MENERDWTRPARRHGKNAGLAAPVLRAVAMPVRHLTKDLFYSYPDWLIAEVCRVHIQTARHWKSGIRKPGPTALQLWSLYVQGRILPDEWQGWGVRKAMLCDPEGHEISQAQLRAWPFVWQLAAEYGKLNAGASELLSRLCARLEPPKKKQRGKQGSRQACRDLLPRVTPDPSTLPSVIIPRSTRRRA